MIFEYIFPFYYTHKYNRKGLESVAYFLEYYISLLIFVFLYFGNIGGGFIYILSLTIFMIVYEMGYIENNVFSIEKDKKPTIRHTIEEIEFLKNSYGTVFLFRYVMVAILVFVLSFYINVFYFIVLLILTRVIFYLYNFKFRDGIINRILFFTLRFLRFFSPIYFLGLVGILLVFPMAIVNLVNNYAWYDRTKVHLPRFFGTKLFDSIAYGFFYFLFSGLGYDYIAYVFLYLTVIKFILFLVALTMKRKHGIQ